MGHPKKPRKKYSTPSHPWQKERIDEEKELSRNYGLKNKKEIWRSSTILSKFKRQAKKLSALDTKQSKLETEQLMNRLKSYGLISEGTYDEVLGLNIESILNRRLQSIIVGKKLARTVKQARQMITHGHVKVGDKTISSPAYLVKIKEEDLITFNDKSSFSDEAHPERSIKKEMEEIAEEVKKTKQPEENIIKTDGDDSE